MKKDMDKMMKDMNKDALGSVWMVGENATISKDWKT